MQNLGMIKLQSIHGGWLQAYSSVGADGQMHASNDSVHEEETRGF